MLHLSMCGCCFGFNTGLSVEKRPAEEKLEGTLVHTEAQQLVLLYWGGPQGLPRQHTARWELLCGGRLLPDHTLSKLKYMCANCFPEVCITSISLLGHKPFFNVSSFQHKVGDFPKVA